MRVALYLRVSTTEQSTAAQRGDLERWAQQRGYTVVQVFEDHGVSGARHRRDRPAFDALMRDAVRGKFDIVGAWSVCRLGRSMPDLVRTLSDLQASKVGLYLHQQGLDTTTPSGEAMYGMMAVFSQFERSMCVARVHAGLAAAKAKGVKLGRPTLPRAVRELALDQLRGGASVRSVVKSTGFSVGSVAALRKGLLASGELASA